jgi:RIO-like serine/threonine protein kinase
MSKTIKAASAFSRWVHVAYWLVGRFLMAYDVYQSISRRRQGRETHGLVKADLADLHRGSKLGRVHGDVNSFHVFVTPSLRTSSDSFVR